jgi:hypothetical protein
MTPQQAIAFVRAKGVVLESARGPVPNLAEAIAGEPIRGSWWAHPKSHEIFACSRAVRASGDVLVCRLVDGKVTYIHQSLWPAVVRLATRFSAPRLAAIREIHTPTGKHKLEITPFPRWVPAETIQAAHGLADAEAAAQLSLVLTPVPLPKSRSRSTKID